MGPQRQTCVFSLPLRSFDEQAVLRWHAFQTGFPGGRSCGAQRRSRPFGANAGSTSESCDEDVRKTWSRFGNNGSRRILACFRSQIVRVPNRDAACRVSTQPSACRTETGHAPSHYLTNQTCRLVKSVNGPSLPRHVIHQQILAEGMWSGEVSLAAAHLCDFLHELD
jgi:hypothetical protein